MSPSMPHPCRLPWFKAMFNWAWCQDGRCEPDAYTQAVSILWNLMLCLTLFTLANLLKGIGAKLLSTHFYRVR